VRYRIRSWSDFSSLKWGGKDPTQGPRLSLMVSRAALIQAKIIEMICSWDFCGSG
jgi:hypothetical protein